MVFLWLSVARGAPLTFEASVAEALASGPAAALAEADRRAALGRARAAGTWLPDPEVSLGRDVEGRSVTVSASVPLAGQPVARGAARGALRDAAEVGFSLDRVSAALGAGQAYLDAERAERLARLASDTLAVAERNRDAARRLLEANEVSAVDAVTLAALAARAVQDATTAQQEALRSRLALEVALGRRPTGETTPSGWPDLAVPERAEAAELPASVLAAHEARAARALGTAARMDLLPVPVVTGGWEQQEAEGGAVFGVGLRLPLFAPGLGAARAAEAEADRAAVVAEQTERRAEAQWVAALGELDAARTAYEAARLDGLEDGLSAIAIALETGEYSLAEYTARRDALVDGLITAIETRYRLEVARLRLWALAGELPPEVL